VTVLRVLHLPLRLQTLSIPIHLAFYSQLLHLLRVPCYLGFFPCLAGDLDVLNLDYIVVYAFVQNIIATLAASVD